MRLISDWHSGARFLIVALVLPLLAVRLFAGPVVSLSSQTLDLGEIPAGVETVRSVTVSNAGDAPLTVLKVSACCGASASVSSPRLAPGETAELAVTLRPLVPSGAFSKSVRLYTDDPDHPVAEVSVIGNARAAAVTPAASSSSVGSRAFPASPVPVTAVGEAEGPQWWSGSGGVKYGIISAMRPLRNFKTNQCCHLISRIARRAFFLNDEEKTRFVGYMSLENPASIHSPLLRYRLLAKGRRMAQ